MTRFVNTTTEVFFFLFFFLNHFITSKAIKPQKHKGLLSVCEKMRKEKKIIKRTGIKKITIDTAFNIFDEHRCLGSRKLKENSTSKKCNKINC